MVIAAITRLSARPSQPSPRPPKRTTAADRQGPRRIACTIAAVPRSLKPHTKFKSGKATFQFYLGDCLRVLESLPPESISAIVTSPPYNLGIQYRSYDDTIPRGRYLEWTSEWVSHAAAALATDG